MRPEGLRPAWPHQSAVKDRSRAQTFVRMRRESFPFHGQVRRETSECRLGRRGDAEVGVPLERGRTGQNEEAQRHSEAESLLDVKSSP